MRDVDRPFPPRAADGGCDRIMGDAAAPHLPDPGDNGHVTDCDVEPAAGMSQPDVLHFVAGGQSAMKRFRV